MSYDGQEKSVYAGAPVELYRFTRGATTWKYTSADGAQVYLGDSYEPEVITRSQIDQSQEDFAGAIEITVPRDNEVAALFIPYLPVIPVGITIYRFHRGDGEVVTAFVGKVGSAELRGSEAILTCMPISEVLRRRIPYALFQRQCNRALYAPDCSVDKNFFKVTGVVSSVSGDTVTSTAFGAKPDGWFNNGWIERAGGDKRWIINHVGNVLTLMNPFDVSIAGESVSAFAGCERTESACADKFSNLVNHLGFKRIPKKNPFDGGIL